MKSLLRRSIGVFVCALALCACTGPRPRIVNQKLEPPRTPGAPLVLTVELRNDGGGEGEVDTVARLISSATGETAAQTARTVNLRGRETLKIVFQFEGVPPGDYRASVEANYPP